MKVCALIDKNTRQWNQELIDVCFTISDAKRILSIPLSCNLVSDCISWPFTKIGIFTVKSAYIMSKCKDAHLKLSAQGIGETSDQDQNAKGWKKLWSIKAPPKMLIPLWRFAHDCLPMGQQLKYRKIPMSEFCPHCGREENVYHAFI
jgi:hypothetical protein